MTDSGNRNAFIDDVYATLSGGRGGAGHYFHQSIQDYIKFSGKFG